MHNPQLAFEATHNGDAVETNLDPSTYWSNPLPYEDNVPAYVLDSGISSYDPAGDLEERPVTNAVFTTPGNSAVWYWYKISHLDPTDQVVVNWYRPNGVLAFNAPTSARRLHRSTRSPSGPWAITCGVVKAGPGWSSST